MRESQREKLHLFANLLASAHHAKLEDSDFKELLQTLEDMSARELQLLTLLERHEGRFGRLNLSPVQYTSQFWNDFMTEASMMFGVDKEEVAAMLARVTRTGCYKEIVGGYLNYAGGQGGTTPLWQKFKQFVLEASK
jgi:hypothetical protein